MPSFVVFDNSLFPSIKDETHSASSVLCRPRRHAFGPLAVEPGVDQHLEWERISLPAHLSIYRQDQEAQWFYRIERGVVKLVTSDEAGRRTITGLRSAGCLLDFSASVAGGRHTGSAVCLTKVIVRRTRAEEFWTRVRANSDLLRTVNRLLTHEIQAQLERETELKVGRVEERILRLKGELEEVSRLRASSGESVVLSHGEIAQLLQITPEHLSRSLRRLNLKVRF